MPEPAGLVLSDDLIFASRIGGTAAAHGLSVQSARTPDVLLDLVRRQAPRCVILDMANPGLVVPELLQRLRETCTPMPYVVAYGSHVDAAGLRAAREAGCDLVLPRSKFVEELPRALPGWLGGPPAG